MKPRCPFLKYREIRGEVQDICSEMSGYPCILELQLDATCEMYDDFLDLEYEEWLIAEHERGGKCMLR